MFFVELVYIIRLLLLSALGTDRFPSKPLIRYFEAGDTKNNNNNKTQTVCHIEIHGSLSCVIVVVAAAGGEEESSSIGEIGAWRAAATSIQSLAV
jgi:hypothetical protein